MALSVLNASFYIGAPPANVKKSAVKLPPKITKKPVPVTTSVAQDSSSEDSSEDSDEGKQ